jgi:hypothetical protein
MLLHRQSARLFLITFLVITALCTTIDSFPSIGQQNTGLCYKTTDFHVIIALEERYTWLRALHYIDLSSESALLGLPMIRQIGTEAFISRGGMRVFTLPFELPLIHAP